MYNTNDIEISTTDKTEIYQHLSLPKFHNILAQNIYTISHEYYINTINYKIYKLFVPIGI